MATITNSVGTQATNRPSDVAMIEALLCVIRRPNGTRYMSSYDGAFSPATGAAILQFQQDQGIVPRPGHGQIAGAATPDAAGLIVGDYGPTLARMNQLIQGTPYESLRIIDQTTVVYFEHTPAEAAASKNNVLTTAGLEPDFAKLIAALIDLMYKTHRIALKLGPKGGYRTFQEQYREAVDPVTHNGAIVIDKKTGKPAHASNAGPGESIHNYGMAIDLGYDGFRWLGPNGVAVTDDHWLRMLARKGARAFRNLWGARNALAFTGALNGGNAQQLFPTSKKDDYIHIQKFDDGAINARNSLLKLLNSVGTMRWQVKGQIYSCDLGLGGAFYPMGRAETIWEKKSTLSAATLAAAQKAVHKPVQASARDLADLQTKLKADFELAEANRLLWVPQP